MTGRLPALPLDIIDFATADDTAQPLGGDAGLAIEDLIDTATVVGDITVREVASCALLRIANASPNSRKRQDTWHWGGGRVGSSRCLHAFGVCARCRGLPPRLCHQDVGLPEARAFGLQALGPVLVCAQPPAHELQL